MEFSSSSPTSGTKPKLEEKGIEKTLLTVKTLMFARARELAGVSEFDLKMPVGATTIECVAELMAKFPPLEVIQDCMALALNCDYVMEPVKVKDGDELAIIPPISGG